MTTSYYDIRPPVLRGDEASGQLCRYADSMDDKVNSCGEHFPQSGLCMVTQGSPSSYKKAVETIGVYFTKELRYDSRPFTAAEYSPHLYHDPSERTTDENTQSFLWYNPHDGHPGHWETFGACTFRLKGSRWLLQWIWMHPYERRKGHLSIVWPFFRSMFGVFVPQSPRSPGMDSFMRKVGYFEVLKAEIERSGLKNGGCNQTTGIQSESR